MSTSTNAFISLESSAYVLRPVDEGMTGKELATLNRISQIVSGVADLPAVLHRVAKTITDMVFADETTITVFNDDLKQLTVAAHYASDKRVSSLLDTHLPVHANDLSLSLILKGRSVIIPDAQNDPFTAAYRDLYRERDWHSVLRLPLRAGGQVIGIINTYSQNQTHVFSERESQVAEVAALQISGVIANARLYTESQKIRQALKTANQTLENQMEELNAMARTIAQSIKKPLDIIYGYNQLMQQASPTDTQQGYLAAISQATHQSREMIDGLLVLDQIRNTTDLTLLPIDMRIITLQVKVGFGQQIREQKASVSMPEEWPKVLGESMWVTKIWTHYLSNALNHGGESPNVTLGFTTLRDGYVRFWVQDEGPGIAPKEQDKLFHPITKIDSSVKSRHLGLSIVKRIAHKLNGRVGVESNIGQGARFYFDLKQA